MNKRAKPRTGTDRRQALIDEITGPLVARHATAAVLFHQALAEHLGLGATDHQCLDLLRERGPMSGAELAAIARLTSSAMSGVVARLERAGYIRREPDPTDGRKQVLSPAPGRLQSLHNLFKPLHADVVVVLNQFDTRQLSAIAEFLVRTTEIVYRHVGLLRTQHLSPQATTGTHR